MKAVILAGGLGSRLSEETINKPKPMVIIGDEPILWHIMKIYSSHGIKEFIICCGYKAFVIKDYFNNYFNTNLKTNLEDGESIVFDVKNKENWKVTLVNTGENTMTGGRLKRLKNILKDEENFCFTYGDGVGDINISNLIEFHKKKKTIVTLTATRPQARYGALTFGENDIVKSFVEKPEGDGSWINGGFFVLKPEAIDKIQGDETSWELEPLNNLANEGQLYAFKHYGFWMPMDTLRDKNYLNNLWNSKIIPWKI